MGAPGVDCGVTLGAIFEQKYVFVCIVFVDEYYAAFFLFWVGSGCHLASIGDQKTIVSRRVVFLKIVVSLKRNDHFYKPGVSKMHFETYKKHTAGKVPLQIGFL